MPNRRKKSFKEHRKREISKGNIKRLKIQEKRNGLKIKLNIKEN